MIDWKIAENGVNRLQVRIAEVAVKDDKNEVTGD